MSSVPQSNLVVHHLNNSRSQRVLWLLVGAHRYCLLLCRLPTDVTVRPQEELNVPYTVKYYQRDENNRAPRELTDIHPLGKSPIITDGDTTLAETGAIIGRSRPHVLGMENSVLELPLRYSWRDPCASALNRVHFAQV